MNGVACPDATHCWAAGFQNSGANATTRQTLIDQWNGTAWPAVAGTPNTSSGNAKNNFLFGVACGDTGHCAAAGDLAAPDPTLILMFPVAAPTPSATPASVPIPATGAAGRSAGFPLGAPLAGATIAALVAGTTVIGSRRRR